MIQTRWKIRNPDPKNVVPGITGKNEKCHRAKLSMWTMKYGNTWRDVNFRKKKKKILLGSFGHPKRSHFIRRENILFICKRDYTTAQHYCRLFFRWSIFFDFFSRFHSRDFRHAVCFARCLYQSTSTGVVEDMKNEFDSLSVSNRGKHAMAKRWFIRESSFIYVYIF